jgi:hypothetical protein
VLTEFLGGICHIQLWDGKMDGADSFEISARIYIYSQIQALNTTKVSCLFYYMLRSEQIFFRLKDST